MSVQPSSLLQRAIFGAVIALASSLCASCSTLPKEAAPVPTAQTCGPASPCSNPIPVKVVIVTMFEVGADSGDAPGEFQIWKERRQLDERFPFPQSHHDLYYNEKTGVLGIVTGMGTAKSTAAIMALGLDQRFDLSHAYWIVAGIAGIDPEDASVGSVAWASYLVDGDLAHEIDAREMPKNWETGYLALFTKRPYDPKRPENLGEVFVANPALRDWAFNLTKDVKLADAPALQKMRARYTKHPNARKPPFVLKGDTFSAMTFWHGAYLNAWANKWTKYWTDGKGEFVTSAMEDTGTFQAIEYLDKIDRADKSRVMVMRAGSNFTMQPPGMTAAESLTAEGEDYSGMLPSLEGLYAVGSVVVDEILGRWDHYKDHLPTE